MDTFEPRLSILPEAQRRLWPELAAVPRGFVLYGGTAIALRLGHRASVDFDFFTTDPLDSGRLLSEVAFLRGADVLQQEPATLTVSVDRGGPIKISFFGTITFGRVGAPEETADRVARVASLADLAATKAKVMLQRVEAKDYLDLAALLRAGLPLEEILGAARALFGNAFNPLIAQKTMSWFEGGDLTKLPAADREILTRAGARDIDVRDVALLSPRLDV